MKKIESAFKYIIFFIIAISFSSFSIQEVNADMGPKPKLNLYVKGLDVDYYYLDLLIDRSEDEGFISYHTSYDQYLTDEQMIEVEEFREYQDPDNYYFALLDGTWVPMHGSLQGVLQSDGSYLHRFDYLGVPVKFKIVILTSDGDILVSDIVYRELFQSEIIYDLSDFSILEQEIEREAEGSYYDLRLINITVVEDVPFRDIISHFFLRLIITVIAEVAIAYFIFKFKALKSLGIIIAANIVTQLLLNIIMFTSWNSFNTIILFLILEIFVFLLEFISYYLFFDEGNKQRIIKYVLVANLVTLCLGLIIVL